LIFTTRGIYYNWFHYGYHWFFTANILVTMESVTRTVDYFHRWSSLW